MSDFFTLEDACNIITGKLDANAYVEGGNYPFFTCAAEPTTIDTHGYDDDVILVAGNNAQGNFHLNRFRGKFNAYQRTYILTKKDDYDLDYIFYALKLELKRLKEHSQGSQTKFLTMPILTSLTFVKRTLGEQQKIASTLSSLDKKIELNNQINQKLEAMAKTLYDYWFVQFDFPDANGKPYKSSGGKMVYSEELKREIPEGWEVKKLSEIESNIVTGKTPPTKNDAYYDGDIPFICIGDIRGNMYVVDTESTLSKAGASSQKKKYISEGSICVTCIASPGLVGFATQDSQTNQQINSIVCTAFENRYYLYFALKDYFKFAKAKTGNTFANMNKQDFSEITLIYPRNKVLKSFAGILKSSMKKIINNSLENKQLTELRDWLLPMLMNGQVKVGDEAEEMEDLMVAEPTVGYGKSN